MSLISLCRKTVKRILFGPVDVPQQCQVGMVEPQSEILVTLEGLGAALDVTFSHMIACASPLLIAVGVDSAEELHLDGSERLALRLWERDGQRSLLGEIRLRLSDIVQTGGGRIYLFRAVGCSNHCIPKLQLWSRYLHYAYLRWRHRSDVSMTASDSHAMAAMFICPRPVVLVSATDGSRSNLFPMNLMGPVGRGHFAFALNNRRCAEALVRSATSVALSSVPEDQAQVARQLGRNHKRENVPWDELPFTTKPSGDLGIPVPEFARRTRELEIESSHKLGSHTLFVARVLSDRRWADGPEYFMVHGIYQARRLRRPRAALE